MKWDIRVETNGQQTYSSVDDLTILTEYASLCLLPAQVCQDGWHI